MAERTEEKEINKKYNTFEELYKKKPRKPISL